MKKLIMAVLSILMFNTTVYAEELIKFDENSTSKVYLIKHSLVQENQTVRSVWVRYDYTKFGSKNLKNDMNSKRYPTTSKVKYGFDCSNKQHKVFYAAVYESSGALITSIKDGAIEDVIPGSVGEAIRNFVCTYESEDNKVSGTSI